MTSILLQLKLNRLEIPIRYFLQVDPKTLQGQVNKSYKYRKYYRDIINETSPPFFIWTFEFLTMTLIAQNENIVEH